MAFITIEQVIQLFLSQGLPYIKEWRNGKIEEDAIKIHEKDFEQKAELIRKSGKRGSTVNSHDLKPQFTPKRFEMRGSIEEVGRDMWDWGHKETLALPEGATKQELVNVMAKIDDSFRSHPCIECKQHYKQHIRKGYMIDHLDTKKDAVRKLFILHNEVNRALGKKIFSVDDFFLKYKYRI